MKGKIFSLILAGIIMFTSSMTCVASEIETPQPIPFIIDSDFSSDVDDALAISVACHFEHLGLIDIRGVALCCTSSRGAHAMSALLGQHKIWDVPIACDVDTGIPIGSKYHMGMTRYPHNTTYFADMVNYYRMMLASSIEKVNIIVTGQMVNINALLNSEGDVHSPLNGYDLIREKVDTIYFVGGKSDGRLENNIFYGGSGDVPNQYHGNTKVAECAKNVTDNAPCRIVFMEADIVGSFCVGGFYEKEDKKCNDIITKALKDYGTTYGSASFDPFGVFIAVMESNGLLENYCIELQPGTMRINLNGTSYFTPNEPTHNHYRIEKLVNDVFYQNEINKCLLAEYVLRNER